MYPESDYLLLSGLQHLRFCPRQCALIHIEQQWSENFFTAAGRVQHEKVHDNTTESRKTVKTERNLKIASALLGVTGCTDAVEFYSDGKIIPVEYKHGKPKENTCDEVQLCAQVICLEEMLDRTIDEGALFYFKIRRRIPVPITDELRKETIELADRFHRFVADGKRLRPSIQKNAKAVRLSTSVFPNPPAKTNRQSIISGTDCGRLFPRSTNKMRRMYAALS